MPPPRPSRGGTRGADRVTISPGTPQNQSRFGTQLEKNRLQMERVEEENFDLKLQITALRESLRKAKEESKSRRNTFEEFYNYEEEDRLGNDGEGEENASCYAALESRLESYRQENSRLKEENLRAETEANYAEAQSKVMREEVDALKRQLAAETLDIRSAMESVESERIAIKAQADALKADAVAGRNEAQKREHSANVRLSGVQMQLDATVSALERERKNCESLRAQLNDARMASGELREEAARLRDAADRRNPATAVGGDVEKTLADQREQIAKQAEMLRDVNLRYESLRSQNELRVKTMEDSVKYPAGRENCDAKLSVPGFELYEKLVAKVQANGVAGRGLVVTGKGNQKRWREIVLNEMNKSLQELYRHTGKLEGDRAAFIETHCKTLLAGQGRQPLQESTNIGTAGGNR